MAEAKAVSTGFVVSNSISEAWEAFKKNWILVYGLTALPIILAVIYTLLAGSLTDANAGFFNLVLYFLYLVVQFIVSMGVIKGYILVTRNKKITVETFKSMAPLILKYIVGQILVGIVVVLGLIAFIIPGIYFALKFLYTPYLIIDKKMGPVEAMKASGKITHAVKWDMIGFLTAVTLLTYLGLLALGIGLLITVPVASLAQVVFYNYLLKRTKV